MVGVDEEKIDWPSVCDFSDKGGIASDALHQFDIVEGEEAFFGVGTDFDVNGEDFSRGSGSKVGGAASGACAEFDDKVWLNFLATE